LETPVNKRSMKSNEENEEGDRKRERERKGEKRKG
jgi:hypothetical protein